MSWYAKPSGAYYLNSNEAVSNIQEMNIFFNQHGYTLESQAGIIGNAYGESGLNPWRWQGDTVNLNGGYGLFQYTPASGYFSDASSLPNYAPNMSTTTITAGASASDGVAQMTLFNNNNPVRWLPSCWRTYWDKTQYAELYELRSQIISNYGSNDSLSLEQFKQIDDVYSATFAFLACFEGPAVPGLANRYDFAQEVYPLLSTETPIEPTRKRKMPLWMYLRHFYY